MYEYICIMEIDDFRGSFSNKLKCGEVGQALEWANKQERKCGIWRHMSLARYFLWCGVAQVAEVLARVGGRDMGPHSWGKPS